MKTIEHPCAEVAMIMEDGVVQVLIQFIMFNHDFGRDGTNETVLSKDVFQNGIEVSYLGNVDVRSGGDVGLAGGHLFDFCRGDVEGLSIELKFIEFIVRKYTETCSCWGAEERPKGIDGEGSRCARELGFADMESHARLNTKV